MTNSQTKTQSVFHRGKKGIRLSIQLCVIIIFSNILFLSLCFLFQYNWLAKTLQENYEENCLKRFQQVEISIGNLNSQMEIIANRLAINDSLLRYNAGNVDRFSLLVRYIIDIRKSLNREIVSYPYIQEIAFYGKSGNAIRVKQDSRMEMNLFSGCDEPIRYYDSKIFRDMKNAPYDLKWFGGYTRNELWNGGSKDDSAGNENDYSVVTGKSILNVNGGDLIFFIDPAYIEDFLRSADNQKAETFLIVDACDNIIVSLDRTRIGTQMDLSPTKSAENGARITYYQDKQLGKIQLMVWDLSVSGGWKLVSEMPYSQVIDGTETLKRLMLISYGACGVLLAVVSAIWVAAKLKPLNELAKAVRHVGTGEFGYSVSEIPENEIGVVIRQFNRMSSDLSVLFEKNRLNEENKRRLEMQALLQQINPHMIYNTLNTIRWMAIINDETVLADSINLFIEFLKPSFRQSGPTWSVSDELEYIRKYIDVMNLRELRGYKLVTSCPEDLLGITIPRFLLQPVVENAILHGYEGKGAGEILVSVTEEGPDCVISVKDNGKGIDKDTLEWLREALKCPETGSGSEERKVGIVNVSRRLINSYGDDYRVVINSSMGQGTEIRLRIRLK